MIARTAADLNAVAVVFLAEIWMPGENWDGVTAPSQCADRREALFVSAETFDTTAAFLWPILRNTAGVRLGEREFLGAEYEGGRFAGLLVQFGRGTGLRPFEMTPCRVLSEGIRHAVGTQGRPTELSFSSADIRTCPLSLARSPDEPIGQERPTPACIPRVGHPAHSLVSAGEGLPSRSASLPGCDARAPVRGMSVGGPRHNRTHAGTKVSSQLGHGVRR